MSIKLHVALVKQQSRGIRGTQYLRVLLGKETVKSEHFGSRHAHATLLVDGRRKCIGRLQFLKGQLFAFFVNGKESGRIWVASHSQHHPHL